MVPTGERAGGPQLKERGDDGSETCPKGVLFLLSPLPLCPSHRRLLGEGPWRGGADTDILCRPATTLSCGVLGAHAISWPREACSEVWPTGQQAAGHWSLEPQGWQGLHWLTALAPCHLTQ